MSKKQGSDAGKQRHLKAVKRKQKPRAVRQQDMSNFGVMLKKAQFAAKQSGVDISQTNVTDVEVLKNAKKHLVDLFQYYNYLIFTDGLIKNEVIKGFKLKMDLVKTGKVLQAINSRLELVTMLEEEQLYATELFEIGDTLQSIALEVMEEIERLQPNANLIDTVILRCATMLPPKADGTEYTRDQIFTQVTMTTAYDFMLKNGIVTRKEQEVKTESETAQG